MGCILYVNNRNFFNIRWLKNMCIEIVDKFLIIFKVKEIVKYDFLEWNKFLLVKVIFYFYLEWYKYFKILFIK